MKNDDIKDTNVFQEISPQGLSTELQTVTPSISTHVHLKNLKKKKIIFLGFLFVGILITVIGFYFFLSQGYPSRVELDSKSKLMLITPSLIPTTTAQKLDLPKEIDNTKLYFIKDDKKLYKRFPLTATPNVILDRVDSYAISPDKKRIAYIKGYGSDEDNDIYIRNLETGLDSVYIDCQEWCVNRAIMWSPKGNYILVDAGTGPEGSFSVYDSNSGDKLSTFGDGNLDWLDEQTIFISQRTEVEPYRPWGAGDGLSLAKVDVTTGKSVILKKADDRDDYEVIGLINSCLYYRKEKVQDPDDWGDISKMSTSYYCLDVENGTTKNVAESETKSEVSLLQEKAKEIISEYALINKGEILRVISHPVYKNWVIVEVYHGDSIYNSDIAIFNLDDPRGTFTSLGTGGQVSWF